MFLRELISNSNDALEKLRLLSLTDKQYWDGSEPLNITIKAEKDNDGPGGRIVITGIYFSVFTCDHIHILIFFRHWNWNESRGAHC